MSDFKIYYQICKNPIDKIKNERYNVRKFILEKDNIIKVEEYNYNLKNLNKLEKEIKNKNYGFNFVQGSNFINIGFPENINYNFLIKSN